EGSAACPDPLRESAAESLCGAITLALASDGQGRDGDNRIASERRADADNDRCPAVQHYHRAGVRIGVTSFMRPVIRDRGAMVSPEFCDVDSPRLADMLDPLLQDLVGWPRPDNRDDVADRVKHASTTGHRAVAEGPNYRLLRVHRQR